MWSNFDACCRSTGEYDNDTREPQYDKHAGHVYVNGWSRNTSWQNLRDRCMIFAHLTGFVNLWMAIRGCLRVVVVIH